MEWSESRQMVEKLVFHNCRAKPYLQPSFVRLLLRRAGDMSWVEHNVGRLTQAHFTECVDTEGGTEPPVRKQ